MSVYERFCLSCRLRQWHSTDATYTVIHLSSQLLSRISRHCCELTHQTVRADVPPLTPTHPYKVHRVVLNIGQVPAHLYVYNTHDVIWYSLFSHGFTCFLTYFSDKF